MPFGPSTVLRNRHAVASTTGWDVAKNALVLARIDHEEPCWAADAARELISEHLTATGATPAPVLQELLEHLAGGDGWDTAVARAVDEKSVTAATKPLVEAGGNHTVDGRFIRWANPSQDAGGQYASSRAPASMIARLATELAHGSGTRRPLHPGARRQPPQRTTTLPAAAPTGPRLPAGRLRCPTDTSVAPRTVTVLPRACPVREAGPGAGRSDER